jgi:hypothetical protein
MSLALCLKNGAKRTAPPHEKLPLARVRSARHGRLVLVGIIKRLGLDLKKSPIQSLPSQSLPHSAPIEQQKKGSPLSRIAACDETSLYHAHKLECAAPAVGVASGFNGRSGFCFPHTVLGGDDVFSSPDPLLLLSIRYATWLYFVQDRFPTLHG